MGAKHRGLDKWLWFNLKIFKGYDKNDTTSLNLKISQSRYICLIDSAQERTPATVFGQE
jgi:hypothetical protein